jgi:hypothetical protein
MFKQEFVDLVNIAAKRTEEFYKSEGNKNQPNPFYVGFGNPDADLLILGKEQGFNITDDKSELGNSNEQLKYESELNPIEWSYYIRNGVPFNYYKFYPCSSAYINAYYPYGHKMPGGHTWSKYGKLVKCKLPDRESSRNNSFLKCNFLSEVNHRPSSVSENVTFTDNQRINFLSHDFYKTFKVIILACGNYLSKEDIEKLFEVSFETDNSKPRERLVIYRNRASNRKVIHTRQLSMDISNTYLENIAELLKT